MNIQEYIKHITKLRRDNKNGWVFDITMVNGYAIGIKFYNLYVQRLQCSRYPYSSTSVDRVKDFNDFIENYISNLPEQEPSA